MYDPVSGRTAIARKTLSLPAYYLAQRGWILGNVLDYGCGKGYDANKLDMDKYDPYWFPDRPTETYNTILCTYVLNVVPPADIPDIISDMVSLAEPGANIYISVRRDIKKQGFTSKGTQQWDVRLSLPVLVEKKGKFCIYWLTC